MPCTLLQAGFISLHQGAGAAQSRYHHAGSSCREHHAGSITYALLHPPPCSCTQTVLQRQGYTGL